MDVKQYLQRIKYADPVNTSIEVLSKLQVTHLLHVPFENLDIHNHIKIDLKNLYDKIVVRKRGGFCYELNGLFYQLLKEIGFNVKMVSARVYDSISKNYSPEFDHLALVVTLKDAKYLVDVGFGEFAICPVKIDLNKEVIDPRGVFRIEAYGEEHSVIKKKNTEGEFIPEYIFSEQERQLEEFYDRCNFHQTSNESHFMQKRICSLPTNTGRITLTGDILKTTGNGEIKERQINSEQEIQQVLWDYFGIRM
jgi:N-hydroxyarylamine O-acetyltransferase